MRQGILHFVLCALLLGAELAAAQTPIYKLLYSAPDPSSQGARPETIFEVLPGLFYFLSGMGGQTFGPSIFSLTSSGTPKVIYSFDPQSLSYALVQGSDGRLYGAIYIGGKADTFYYSLTASGQDLLKFQTGQWGSMWMITPTEGKLYDAAGTIATPQTFGFVRIDESSGVKLIRKLSQTQGVPGVNNKLVLAPDGSLYGIGGTTKGFGVPLFIFRLTQSGEYKQIATFPPQPRHVGLHRRPKLQAIARRRVRCASCSRSAAPCPP
jgi:hypothetical protein